MRNEASGAFRIPNKRNVPCEECGRQAVLEVIPDGFYDPPESFGVRITCSRGCSTKYSHLTPQDMHKKLGLPLKGWFPQSEAR